MAWHQITLTMNHFPVMISWQYQTINLYLKYLKNNKIINPFNKIRPGQTKWKRQTFDKDIQKYFIKPKVKSRAAQFLPAVWDILREKERTNPTIKNSNKSRDFVQRIFNKIPNSCLLQNRDSCQRQVYKDEGTHCNS